MKPIKCYKVAKCSGIYLHIAKCGGTSIHKVIRPYINLHVTHGHGFYIIQEPNNYHYEYGYADFTSVEFSWAWVRNPFARLAAVYTVFSKRHNHRLSVDKFMEIIECNGIIADRRPMFSDEPFKNGIYSVHEIWTHSRPYFWSPLDDLSYIGKLEEIDKSWKYVQDQLGIIEKLPHINQSGKPHNYMSIFSPPQRQKIIDLYYDDFKRFQYLT